MVKARLKKYLSVTKKEWNGMVILVILIAAVLAAPYVYQMFRKDNTINFNDFDKAAAQLREAESRGDTNESRPLSDVKLLHPVMFPFNPNQLTIRQWQQLGLSERQAAVIKHYEAKGGRFYSNDDVKKMYVVTAEDYKRLEPYIQIPQQAHIAKKARPGEIIELNTADSAKLTALPGIGHSFAVRIIRFRNRLGGFYRKEQLKDVYGIDPIKYAGISGQVSVDPRKVKKININTISFDQLRLFPYLRYKQVNAIIQYRVQHGSYSSIADMKNVAILDQDILTKLEPYLNFK